jgi:hypothetical protein
MDDRMGDRQGREDKDGDDESTTAALASIAQLLQAKAQIKQQENTQGAAEVKLDKNSTLWQPELALPASDTLQLVLFGSVIQTVRPSLPRLLRVLVALHCSDAHVRASTSFSHCHRVWDDRMAERCNRRRK